MKKSIGLFFLLFMSINFWGCVEEELSTNILLYDKPLNVIQKYIYGKWQFLYGKGGYISNTIFYCDSCYIEITRDNRFYSNSLMLSANYTKIEWVKALGTYTNGEKTYLMTFLDHENVPRVYVIERIINDTLIFHDNSSDATFYHYLRIYK